MRRSRPRPVIFEKLSRPREISSLPAISHCVRASLTFPTHPRLRFVRTAAPTIQDVAHREEVVHTLEKALETANIPTVFYGPPGTGKTTCALAICRQLFGPELFKSRVLELNASDERGISVVRNKIKGFASTAVGAGAPGYPSPPTRYSSLTRRIP